MALASLFEKGLILQKKKKSHMVKEVGGGVGYFLTKHMFVCNWRDSLCVCVCEAALRLLKWIKKKSSYKQRHWMRLCVLIVLTGMDVVEPKHFVFEAKVILLHQLNHFLLLNTLCMLSSEGSNPKVLSTFLWKRWLQEKKTPKNVNGKNKCHRDWFQAHLTTELYSIPLDGVISF